MIHVYIDEFDELMTNHDNINDKRKEAYQNNQARLQLDQIIQSVVIVIN